MRTDDGSSLYYYWNDIYGMDTIHTTLGTLINDDRYYLHHTSYARGYVSRKADYDELPVHRYKGRFGTGYTVDLPSYESSQYCRRQYYILRKWSKKDGT